MEKLDERVKRDQEKLPEMRQKVAALPAPSGPDPELLRAEQGALEAYLAALAPMYGAEREAGLHCPPAPRDPAARADDYARGTRLKIAAVVLGVRKVGDRTEVRFARGAGDDPTAWKDEAVAAVDGEFAHAPGAVVTLEAFLTAGKNPAWRILSAQARQ